jgi:antitoxin component YwqK of YwqJK toxin-antitoxin module
MKKLLFILLFNLAFNAYGQDTLVINNSKWIGSLRDGLKQGSWLEYVFFEYFNDYQLVSEGTFVNDKKHGTWKFYGLSHWGSMELISHGNFVNDKKEGKWIHEGGYGYKKGDYKNNLKHGVWLSYNMEVSDSNVYIKENYINGVPEGLWELYDPEDGKLLASGKMTKGQMDGFWKISGSSGGELIINPDTVIYQPDLSGMIYHLGVECADNGYNPEFSGGVLSKKTGEWKFYYTKSLLYCQGKYLHGKKTGVWKWYHENGQLSYTGEYKDGLKEGVWTEYYDNGTLKCIDTYSGGLLHGPFSLNLPGGTLHITGNFSDGFRSDEWICYSASGDTIHIGSYDGKPDNPIPSDPMTTRCGLEESKFEIENQLRVSEPFYLPYSNRHGIWKEHIQWTSYMEKGPYVHGKRHGEWNRYSDGQLVSITNYTQGSLDGKFVEFNWNYEYVWRIGEYKNGDIVNLQIFEKADGVTKEEYLKNESTPKGVMPPGPLERGARN